MAKLSPVSQDVLAHFAFRDGRAGHAFDKEGFWRLATARGAMTEEIFAAAMRELADGGYVVQSGEYFLTRKGQEYLYGKAADADDERAPQRGKPTANG